MGKIWRFVGFASVTLVVAGVLLAGTGLLTGASVERVSAVLSGELDGLHAMYRQIADFISGFFPG